MTSTAPTSPFPALAFIGGGNMASAVIGGLIRQGVRPADIAVVEPYEATREQLRQQFGLQPLAAAGPLLRQAGLVVWAVKPQTFREAAAQSAPHLGDCLHLSVAAGIRSDSIAAWLKRERIVRAMPNTPALVGRGMTGLYARAAVSADDRSLIERVVATTGESLWVQAEEHLDAVTALSGSGPAYVFLFLEAMIEAGAQMGLSREQAKQLSIATFSGAAQLARDAQEPPQVLRERVTSKGGTTYAAITCLQADDVPAHFIKALHAARDRARELGDEFGAA